MGLLRHVPNCTRKQVVVEERIQRLFEPMNAIADEILRKAKHCQWLRRVTPKLWKMQLLHQVSSRFWAYPSGTSTPNCCRPTSNQMSFPKVLCLCLENSRSQVGLRCLPVFHLWRPPSFFFRPTSYGFRQSMASTLSFSDMPKAEFTPQIKKSSMRRVFSLQTDC